MPTVYWCFRCGDNQVDGPGALCPECVAELEEDS